METDISAQRSPWTLLSAASALGTQGCHRTWTVSLLSQCSAHPLPGSLPGCPWLSGCPLLSVVILGGTVPMVPLGVPTCQALVARLQARATLGLWWPVMPASGVGLPHDHAPSLPLGQLASRACGCSSPTRKQCWGRGCQERPPAGGVAGARVCPAASSSAEYLGLTVMPFLPRCQRARPGRWLFGRLLAEM